MIKTVMFSVVILTGLAVSAPAQIRVQARLGRVANISIGLAGRYAPPPRVQRRRVRQVAPGARYAPVVARYTTVRHRVWVPGYQQVVGVPATFGWSIDYCGQRVWGIVRPAYSRTVWHRGRWQYRTESVRVRRY